MDLGFCGIIDIVVVLLLVLTVIIGYKKGFVKKFIALFSILIAIALAILLFGEFAYRIKEWGLFGIYKGFYNGAYEKISSISGTDTTEVVKNALNIPGWIAEKLVKWAGNPTMEELADTVADQYAMFFTKIIAFAIIFVGTLILFLILRILCNVFRKSKFVRVVDGILGVALSLVIYVASISLIFFIMSLIYNHAGNEGFNNFLNTDLKLLDEGTFRLSKWLFQGNLFDFIKNLFV